MMLARSVFVSILSYGNENEIYTGMLCDVYNEEMAAKHVKTPYSFPSINKYKHGQYVSDGSVWIGRVKIDGSNAGVVYNKTDETLVCQSRNHFLDDINDNLEFHKWFLMNKENLRKFIIK